MKSKFLFVNLNFLLNNRFFFFFSKWFRPLFYVCLPKGDDPNYVNGRETSSGGGGGHSLRAVVNAVRAI